MSQQQSRANNNRNGQQSQRGSNGNGSRPQTSNAPDIRIEAMVEKTDENGEVKTVWVPIGAAWRTEKGDYTGELRAEPIEWRGHVPRRIFLRMREAQGDGG